MNRRTRILLVSVTARDVGGRESSRVLASTGLKVLRPFCRHWLWEGYRTRCVDDPAQSIRGAGKTVTLSLVRLVQLERETGDQEAGVCDHRRGEQVLQYLGMQMNVEKRKLEAVKNW